MLMDQARRAEEKELAAKAQRELEWYDLKERYDQFAIHMPGDALQRRLQVTRRTILQTNTHAKAWPGQVKEEYAMRLLREDLARDLDLPSIEDFSQQPQ